MSLQIGKVLCLIINVGIFIEAFKKDRFMTTGLAWKTNTCDIEQNTFLVEQFFKTVYNEMQNKPPKCVCVRMCDEQPTYCYPNGCLKSGKKKNDSNPIHDKHGDRDASRSDPNHATENKVENDGLLSNLVNVANFEPLYTKKTNDYAAEFFKDRYKNLLKYKKVPKFALRYNLKEKVKKITDKQKTILYYSESKPKSAFLLNVVADHINPEKTSKTILSPKLTFSDGDIMESNFEKRDVKKSENSTMLLETLMNLLLEDKLVIKTTEGDPEVRFEKPNLSTKSYMKTTRDIKLQTTTEIIERKKNWMTKTQEKSLMKNRNKYNKKRDDRYTIDNDEDENERLRQIENEKKLNEVLQEVGAIIDDYLVQYHPEHHKKFQKLRKHSDDSYNNIKEYNTQGTVTDKSFKPMFIKQRHVKSFRKE